jgi:23S rRNA (uracil1939-C5)-methyltransferase
VQAIDAEPLAVGALTAAVGTAPGLKPIRAETRDLFRRPLPAAELNRFGAAVFDPPRAGAAAQAAELARSKVPVVVGVSCNPATFARDARLLISGGYRLERVTPVDQFLWSPHIELVSVFRR